MLLLLLLVLLLGHLPLLEVERLLHLLHLGLLLLEDLSVCSDLMVLR